MTRGSGDKPIINRATAPFRAPGLNGKGYMPKPQDEHLLARIIYAESLSNPEDYEAIGWAVVNRVGERQFGSTLHKVINQPKGFQTLEVGGGPKGTHPLWNETEGLNPLTDGTLPPDRRAGWRRAQIVANGILGGRISDPTRGATYFISSSKYIRGDVSTAPGGFFQSGLRSGRLVDSSYVSASPRKTKNHFYLEVPPSTPTTGKH